MPTATETAVTSPDENLTVQRAAYIETVVSLQARPLAQNSIGLNWDLVTGDKPYRVYSDMGAGYGIYLFRGQVTAPDFVDIGLRSGLNYAYRIETTSEIGPQVIGFTGADTYHQIQSAATSDTPPAPQVRANIIPAPTPLPSDALLLGLMSDVGYTDGLNTLHVVGEIRNDTNLDVGQMSIDISFYDANGNFITETQGKTMQKTLTPGERASFLVSLPHPEGMHDYSIKAVGRPAEPELLPQVTVIQVKAYEDEVGFYHVAGIIENRGTIPVERPKVVATLYGRGDVVINVGFAYPDLDRLDPGQRAGYDVRFTYFPKVVTRRVIVVTD